MSASEWTPGRLVRRGEPGSYLTWPSAQKQPAQQAGGGGQLLSSFGLGLVQGMNARFEEQAEDARYFSRLTKTEELRHGFELKYADEAKQKLWGQADAEIKRRVVDEGLPEEQARQLRNRTRSRILGIAELEEPARPRQVQQGGVWYEQQPDGTWKSLPGIPAATSRPGEVQGTWQWLEQPDGTTKLTYVAEPEVGPTGQLQTPRTVGVPGQFQRYRPVSEKLVYDETSGAPSIQVTDEAGGISFKAAPEGTPSRIPGLLTGEELGYDGAGNAIGVRRDEQGKLRVRTGIRAEPPAKGPPTEEEGPLLPPKGSAGPTEAQITSELSRLPLDKAIDAEYSKPGDATARAATDEALKAQGFTRAGWHAMTEGQRQEELTQMARRQLATRRGGFAEAERAKPVPDAIAAQELYEYLRRRNPQVRLDTEGKGVFEKATPVGFNEATEEERKEVVKLHLAYWQKGGTLPGGRKTLGRRGLPEQYLAQLRGEEAEVEAPEKAKAEAKPPAPVLTPARRPPADDDERMLVQAALSEPDPGLREQLRARLDQLGIEWQQKQ